MHKITHTAPLFTTDPKPPKSEAPPILQELLNGSGIKINGYKPWDIQVYDNKVYQEIFSKGSLGFGIAYMDGLWDAEQLDETFHRLLSIDIEKKLQGWGRIRYLGEVVRHQFFNLQSESRAFEVGEKHYDIGNDVFEAMLDSSMSYSCGYWAKARNLEEAQYDKLDIICRKLELKPGERLLEIGCGWGGLARHAAEHYGVQVVGVTVSKEQQKLAQQRCEGLPILIELMDYRKMEGRFDKIVSVGMFEHVGPKNYPVYFQKAYDLLHNDGLFLLHTIGSQVTTTHTDPWIDQFIFPNGKVPSANEITRELEHRFIVEDWHNFGQDYDRTLMAWWDNFNRAWPRLEARYGQRFYRMWRYYLMCCAGFFRARQGQLWQLVLSKQQRRLQYRSIR